MRISELEAALREARERHGDLEVGYWNEEAGGFDPIDGVGIVRSYRSNDQPYQVGLIENYGGAQNFIWPVEVIERIK